MHYLCVVPFIRQWEVVNAIESVDEIRPKCGHSNINYFTVLSCDFSSVAAVYKEPLQLSSLCL